MTRENRASWLLGSGLLGAALTLGDSAWAATGTSASEATAQASPFSFVMSAADIPTLGEWAAVVLLLTMTVYAFRRLRQRRALPAAILAVLLLTSSGALLALGGLASSLHDPATMLGTPRGHSREVTVSLTAELGQTVTGMSVHYRRSGDVSWREATGSAAPTGGCPDCWAATMDTNGWGVGDTIEYYFEAVVGGISSFAYRKTSCGQPANPAHGSYTACDPTDSGGTCTLSCASGYSKTGDATCTEGAWDTPSCTPDPCSQPTNPAHGNYASCNPTLSGGSCALACASGYTKSGDATCTAGSWDSQTCNPNPCSQPSNPAHGSYASCNPTPSGDTCTLTCASGYTRSGNATCTLGSWGSQTCNPNPCSQPSNPAHGSYASCNPTPSGDTCTLTCASGYTRSGNATCTLGSWDSQTCDPVSCPGAQMVDNYDGTVTDPCSNLVWQKTPGPKSNLANANTYCSNNTAGLPGSGWRLPNISELRTLVRGYPNTEPGGACAVADPTCLTVSCGINADHSICGKICPCPSCHWDTAAFGDSCDDYFWSSSPITDIPGYIWRLAYFNATIVDGTTTSTLRVPRCVR